MSQLLDEKVTFFVSLRTSKVERENKNIGWEDAAGRRHGMRSRRRRRRRQ